MLCSVPLTSCDNGLGTIVDILSLAELGGEERLLGVAKLLLIMRFGGVPIRVHTPPIPEA